MLVPTCNKCLFILQLKSNNSKAVKLYLQFTFKSMTVMLHYGLILKLNG